MFRYFVLFLFSCSLATAAITTPYPETILLKQINSAEKERIRHAQGQKKFDRQPTGFYIETGKTVVVFVENLTPAADEAAPVLTIGTLGFNVEGRTSTEYKLIEGENRISATHGGLLYLSFVSEEQRQPTGEVNITFTSESQQIRAPRYIYGLTTDAEFEEMLTVYPTPDVTFHSDCVIVCVTRNAALQYAIYNGKEDWMNGLHRLIEEEDKISGMDNNDDNSLHHRLKAGEVRFLIVENTTTVGGIASSNGFTGFPTGSIRRILTPFGPNNNSWLIGHEVGHQHQQPAYQINQATESTVNLYSYVVERDIQGPSYNRTTEARWTQVQNTFLNHPVGKRVYDMPDAQLESLIGFNRDEMRFMPWEQLFLLFGDDFYKTLHRVTREEKVLGGSADERRAYLIWKASQITGYDLTDYFNHWGIRVTDSILKNRLRAGIYTALSKGNIIPLPYPVNDLLIVTGQQRPAWTPLPLKGIMSSAPQEVELDRTDWTVTTSIIGVPDAVIGGENPYYIIDGSLTTAFSFIKPGRTYEGVTGPSDYIPSFTIDMQTKQDFNYFIYRHRTANNNSEFIRARKISFYGKNIETESFTPIVENIVIDPVENKDEIKVSFNKAEYRYLQLVINDWNKDNGSTIQVSNFVAGIENPEDLLTPEPYPYMVTVQAGEGIVESHIVTIQAGINTENSGSGEFIADEDSEMIVRFKVSSGYDTPTVTVDGDPVMPDISGDGFTLKLHITNHTLLSINALKSTGNDITSGEHAIKIYPNPVSSGQALTIDASNSSIENGLLIIYGLDGKELERNIFNKGIEKIRMNYVPGIYFLKINTGKEIATYKLIIKN